jgi:F-box-like
MQMDDLSIGSNSKDDVASQWEKSQIQQEPSKTHQKQPYRLLSSVVRLVGQVFQRATIGSLPDNVLIEIFDFYQVKTEVKHEHPWDWEKLVHVCRRWRYIIFESPVRLNLELICTEKSPVRKLLDVWPPFPLIIQFNFGDHIRGRIDVTDNLIAALERRDRVRRIHLGFPTHMLLDHHEPSERIVTARQWEESFPALRSLSLGSLWPKIVLPDTFLNGSTPCLQTLFLSDISFLSLPRILSSTSDLTWLLLFYIPDSGYIPPETMATSLSAQPKLKHLAIMFKTPAPHVERRNLPVPPPTRIVLPALTSITFSGESEYFEVLAARFDAPLLDDLTIIFSNQPDFDIPQTVRFSSHLASSSHSLTLLFKLPKSAMISFHSTPRCHKLEICCDRPDHQVIFVTHICSQILPRSSVKSLSIECDSRIDDINSTQWLQLFHLFPSVQSLQISVHLEQSITSALETPAEESLAAAEVFPSLHSLSIVGNQSGETVQQPIRSFVAARQHSGRPVAVSRVQIFDEEHHRR